MRVVTALIVGLFGFLALFVLTSLLIWDLRFSVIIALFGGGTLAAFVLTVHRLGARA